MRERVSSAAFFAALALPFAAVIHVAAEGAALGGAAGLGRHVYLAALSVAALGYLAWYAGSLRASERRRRVALLTAALPGGGRGFAFGAAVFASQFGFVVATELLEGAPFASGNVILGIACALVGTLACTLLLAVLRFRIIEGLVSLFEIDGSSLPSHPAASASARPSRRARLEPYLHFCWNRPPPVAPSIDRFRNQLRSQEHLHVRRLSGARARAARVGARPDRGPCLSVRK